MSSHTNNIFGIRINMVISNGSVNFGNTWHTGHQASVKLNTGSVQNGDAIESPIQFNNANYVYDKSVFDQPQKQVFARNERLQ